jgi:hypothetical protein
LTTSPTGPAPGVETRNRSTTRGSWAGKLDVALIAAGIVMTLFLAVQVPDELFYSGDAGLKALMVRQFARGEWTTALDLDAPAWAKELWNKGLYPFGPIFVYEVAGSRRAVFPVFFLAASVPFYEFLGYRGLYILPLAALWLLWFRFRAAGRRLGLPPAAVTAGLALLIFATPLTVYGAMFWEHTLGALLVFFGAEFLLADPARPHGRRAALGLGLLAGLAPWFRSEAFLLCGLFGFWAAARFLRSRERSPIFFVTGLAAGMAGLCIVNLVLFRHPLGLHVIPVAGIALAQRFARGYDIGRRMIGALFKYWPALLLLAAAPLARKAERKAGRRGTWPVLLVSLAFVLGIPFSVPNWGGKQWGPRYLLVLVPILCLVIVTIFTAALREPGRMGPRYALLAVLAALGLWSGLVATIGAVALARDYRSRVAPVLDLVRESPETCVIVNQQYVAQELEAAMPGKIFFWPRDEAGFETLAEGLYRAGQPRALLISFLDEVPERERRFRPESPLLAARFDSRGRLGSYSIYGLELVPR